MSGSPAEYTRARNSVAIGGTTSSRIRRRRMPRMVPMDGGFPGSMTALVPSADALECAVERQPQLDADPDGVPIEDRGEACGNDRQIPQRVLVKAVAREQPA